MDKRSMLRLLDTVEVNRKRRFAPPSSTRAPRCHPHAMFLIDQVYEIEADARFDRQDASSPLCYPLFLSI